MTPLRARFGRLSFVIDCAQRDRSGLLVAAGSGVRAREIETCTRLAADVFLEMAAPVSVSGHGYRQNLGALYGWPGTVMDVGPIYRGWNTTAGLYVVPEDPRAHGYETPLEAARVAVVRFLSALRMLPRS